MKAAMRAVVGAVKHEKTRVEDDDDEDGSSKSSAVPAAVLAQDSSSSAAYAMGPFDQPIGMIKDLITTLKDSANEDMNHHQWCQDSIEQNKRDRLAAKATIDMRSSEMHWADTAVKRLETDIASAEAELAKLKKAKDLTKSQTTEEKERLRSMFEDHKVYLEILEKSVIVLKNLCELDGGAAVLLQRGDHHAVQADIKHSAPGQCADSVELLQTAVTKIKALDTYSKGYEKTVESIEAKYDKIASDGTAQREQELISAKNAKASRMNDVSTAESGRREKQGDLVLIQEAAKELDQQCGGHNPDAHEERQAMRAQEIDSLKNALAVLEGEAVPV